ncbi:MAG: hypothetical protein ACXAB6_10250 [Candidatus Thorarchaeota archaeon]
MKLDITSRAANLHYAIRDIVVAARKYEKDTGETPLYLNIGDPIKYDWKTPDFMGYKRRCQRIFSFRW